MAQQNQLTSNKRFVSGTITELQEANRGPVSGYQDVRTMSIEDAVESIVTFVPRVQKYAEKAIEKRRQNTHLTRDESAAIYLYTMPNDFYPCLNEALRFKNRGALRSWFPFLKLFIAALKKLPSRPATVWRGVGDNFGPDFVKDREHIWWSVNSCTLDQNVSRMFADSKGTLFCIYAINGKDITKYSANQEEEEIILMPGTCLRVKSAYPSDLSTVVLEECGTIPAGQNVMLSYHGNSKDIISAIHQTLQKEHISVWFDEGRDVEHNIYNSLAHGVEKAAIVCCFLTSDYEKSEKCKLELKYAHKRQKRIILCLLNDMTLWQQSNGLKTMIEEFEQIEFRDISKSNIHLKVRELIDQINKQTLGRECSQSQSLEEPTYLFELIKYDYICNSCIERFMNPSITYPIEQSYINLAIVETKEHQEKEKKLRDTQNTDAVMGSFEEMHDSKAPIDVKDIFKTCKDQTRQVLVFGRAGIGKSTFCRYVAYQWATGAIWSEYELVVLIPLRSLAEQGYQTDIDYYLIDILKKQYLSNMRLSDTDEKRLQEQIRKSRILWLLDGYDEIVQNKSTHLQHLIANLLKTSDHIVTSRPHMTNLSRDVRMEITGFIDANIPNYVKRFFDQLGNESQNSSAEHDRLLSFLRLNPRIWGIAHIPINLELICSVSSNTDWTKTKAMTMTMLYDKLTEWICRRYLEKQTAISTNQMDTAEVYRCCQNELIFLQTLAFQGMKSNAILLGPDLLKKAKHESNCSFIDYPHLLNIGILKSSTQHGIGTRIEAEKDYYFVHLSFQEYFAARYLVNALQNSNPQTGIEFIQRQKYNQWFRLVFMFASGLLSESRHQQSINTFWETILGKPLDLVGIRHMDLTISCLDEAGCDQLFPDRDGLMNSITGWIERAFTIRQNILREPLKQTLRSCTAISNEPTIQIKLIELLQDKQTTNITKVLEFISYIPLTNPMRVLVHTIMLQMKHTNFIVRKNACDALGKMGEKAATSQVISALVSALGDKDFTVIRSAYDALGKMGKKAPMKEVINRLVSAVSDKNYNIRSTACAALCEMDDKAAKSEVISGLVSAFDDKDPFVRRSACDTLGRMGEKAATSEVISRIVTALGDKDTDVRCSAWDALGTIDEKAATSEVINRLVSALLDKDPFVRHRACYALGKMGEKAATIEVISRLVSALRDKDSHVRRSACFALGQMREKAATSEVISRLVSALGDKDSDVRRSAWNALATMGEKAPTSEVINRLVIALRDKDSDVRSSACDALCEMGEKAATSEAISELVSALDDKDSDVRRCAYYALGKMGEKAATSEVINRLVSELRDKNSFVRSSACDAFVKMGEKTATSEVINRLVSALSDTDSDIRRCVCYALGKVGEKAATSDVISGLVSALDDKDYNVRCSAWDALCEMGEKAATSEVISRIVSALDDKDYNVRRSAWDVLCEMGEKAATREVISRLVSVLDDKDPFVRRSACDALCEMGEKAATPSVISQLVSALRDKDSDVRRCAYYALGKMGEKAATSEAISGLVTALGDQDSYVITSACDALGRMGEKAATKEVISGLLAALDDEDSDVITHACDALGKMGEKAATSDVISGLVTALDDENSYVITRACAALCEMGEKAATKEVISGLVSALQDVWDDSGVDRNYDVNMYLSVLSVVAVSRDKEFTYDDPVVTSKRYIETSSISAQRLLKVYIDTEDPIWLPAVVCASLINGNAITVVGNTIFVYERQEVIEISFSGQELIEKLQKTFDEQLPKVDLEVHKGWNLSRKRKLDAT